MMEAQIKAGEAEVQAAEPAKAESRAVARDIEKGPRREDDGARILYHYTNEAGYAGILETELLYPSLWLANPTDVRHGDGQYLTDIVPESKTPGQLSLIFLRRPFFSYRFTHYIGIDASGLNVTQGRPHVFVVPNTRPLDPQAEL